MSIGQRLIDGESLDLEDLIDVLTLKDNTGISVSDSTIALDRLVKDEVSTLSPFSLRCQLTVYAFVRSRCLTVGNKSPFFQSGEGYSFGTSESTHMVHFKGTYLLIRRLVGSRLPIHPEGATKARELSSGEHCHITPSALSAACPVRRLKP